MNILRQISDNIENFELWNDSCSYDELKRSIEDGAQGATTNPVIVLQVLKKELHKWEPIIKEYVTDNPTCNEDELAWGMIKKMVEHSGPLLNDIYKETSKKGRISLQTNAKFYRNANKMNEHAIELAKTVENSMIKAPTSRAGIQTFEELTYQGISINATVSFSVSQAIAVAKAVERGLERRRQEGLDNSKIYPVCTIMIGRVDDYLKTIAKEVNFQGDESILDYAGIAVMKHALQVYEERSYETKLLIAAYRHIDHFAYFVGDSIIQTIPFAWQEKINQAGLELAALTPKTVSEEIINELRVFDEFSRAYDCNGLTDEEFETFGPFVQTMNQFLAGYDELVTIVRPYIVNRG